MSRTISQVDLGSSVYVRENNTDVEYILTRKDSHGAELLRKKPYDARRMNPQNTTVYDGCEMDSWLIDESTGFLSLFSATLRSNLVSRSISTFTFGDTECSYISRKCYLYSYGDLFMTTPDALYPEVNVVIPLMINIGTMSQDTARIARDTNNSVVYWWLRSPNSATAFRGVSSYGNAYGNNASNTSSWCRPVLNVSPDTIVSDSGADIIYLLPEEKPRVVEFKGKMGNFTSLPRFGCIEVISSNLTNVTYKVTNNYGDAEPVWQTVQNHVQFEFSNKTKQTESYEIGIWCYGQTPNLNEGYFEQPEMLVEV